MIAFLCTSIVVAQDKGAIIGNIYGNYAFSDRMNFYYGHVTIGDGFEYGAGLEFFPLKSTSIEIKYLRTESSMSVYRSNGHHLSIAPNDNGAINYVLLGGNHYFDKGNKLTPYLGAGIGLGIIENPINENDTNFAWEVKAGVKIKTSLVVSLSLQATLQSMIINTDYAIIPLCFSS